MGLGQFENSPQNFSDAVAQARASIYPQVFVGPSSIGRSVYLCEPLARRLADFFQRKGLAGIKDEDGREQWYEDWLAYQSTHQIYARLLSTRQFSRLGGEFDLLRYTRFLELFAYFSPAHGYSLQTTFLGLSAVLMGTNVELKRETVAALEAGGLLAFGISERGHGSDLLGGEFTVSEVDAGQFVANGAKYYIGNSNCADFISILARKNIAGRADHLRRAPFILFALRPRASKGFHSVKKIHTLGVRAGFVGEFEVQDHPLSQRDVIAEGREAWSAVFGTVTLGKLFLGFGSIGICEHALEEAVAHLRGRTLYGKPAADMPHLRATMAQAYARLTAMKLYAYRALDYVHAADAADRRYLLFAAVQKAKVSTEGVKVMAMLSECIGAKGFEADTYFEMALRDIQLIPGLEGSTHINLGLTAQFIPRYFADSGAALRSPDSLVAGEIASHENPYLFAALGGGLKNIAFPHFLDAYRPLAAIANVRLFAKAAKAFQLLVRDQPVEQSARADTPMTLALGQCLATIAYAQLIAENAVRLGMEMPLVSVIFHALVRDFSMAALTFASCPGSAGIRPALFRRMVSTPSVGNAEIDFVARQMTATGDCRGRSE